MAFTTRVAPSWQQSSDDQELLIRNPQPPGRVSEPYNYSQNFSLRSFDSRSDHDYHRISYRSDNFVGDEKSAGTTDYQVHQTKAQLNHRREHPNVWQPFWLRKSVLLSLASLYIMLVVALIVLWRFSILQNGISLQLTRNQYAWVYGPTVILVVVVCFWRQVDYWCKVLSPWHNLVMGPAPASRTVLLDYVSLLQVNALFKAIRLGNYTVALSIVGFGLLKVTLIFSTGLLVSTPTSLTDPTSALVVTTKFDAMAYNATLSSYTQISPPSPDSSSSNGSSAVYAYYGVAFNGMSTLDGMYKDATFQSFRQTDNARNATSITANVQVFQPMTRCEIGNVTVTDVTAEDFDANTGGGNVYIRVDTPTCRLGYGNVVGGTYYNMIGIPKKNPRTEVCAPQELTPDMRWVNCSVPSRSGSSQVYNASDGDRRWLMTLSDIRYGQTFGPRIGNTTSRNITSWSRNVVQVVALLCSVEYQMVPQPVTLSFSAGGQPRAQFLPSSNTTFTGQLKGMTNTQLNQAVMRALGAASSLFPLRRTNMGATRSGSDTLFGLMDLSLNGDGSYKSLLSSTNMKRAAETNLNGLSGVVARNNLLVADNTNIIGAVTYTEDRLHVRDLSLWFMIAFFIVMSVLTVLILMYRPYKVVPCNPDSLGASAALLKTSDPVFQRAIAYLGYSRQSLIRMRLSGYMFLANMSDHFTLSMISSQMPERKTPATESTPKDKGVWYPWAFRYALLLPTVAVPMAAIVALEALQRVSDSHDGLVAITSKTTENIFYYLTSLVMLLMATMYNNLDFTIACFAPFSAMRANSLPAKRSIMFHLLGEVPVFALWQTVKARHFGASLSNVAGFVGSTLTIVASGLWLLDINALSSHDFSAERMDTWNTTGLSYANDSGAAVIYSMIKYQNLSYPRWTFDELAFPHIGRNLGNASGTYNTYNRSLADLSTDNTDLPGTKSYHFAVPALRANLNCTVVSADRIFSSPYNVSTSHPGSYMLGQAVTASLPLPVSCPAGPGRNLSSFNVTLMSQVYTNSGPDPGTYLAQMYDLHLSDLTTYESGTTSSMTQPDNPAGCPSLAFALGYLRRNSTPAENVTAMICYQELQEVRTSLTLKQDIGPDSNTIAYIDPSLPPVPDENAVHLLTNGTIGITAFPWRPQYNLQQGLQRDLQNGGTTNIGSFFDIIFNSSTTTSPEPYMHPQNADKLVKAINHAYRQYMAQVISLNMRVARNLSDPSTVMKLNNGADTALTITGSASTPTPRLKVNQTTKLVLQVCLAIMTLCGVAAYFMVNIRGTLGHDPCTIAGTMSLLAGSELVEQMPEGSERMSEDDLNRALTQKGFLYSLGWWDRSGSSLGGLAPDQRGKRFGVDIGRADPI